MGREQIDWDRWGPTKGQRPRVGPDGRPGGPVLARVRMEVPEGGSSRAPGSFTPVRGSSQRLRAKRRAYGGTPGRTANRLGRSVLVLGLVAMLAVVAVTVRGVDGKGRAFPAPSEAALAGMSVPQRVVAIAESQVGYTTEPSGTYCNKFSASWDAGDGGCPAGETSEAWCADFAAWAWRLAGVPFTYGYGPGQINGAAVSFYEWAVANGRWHPATSGYVASPGDVAVYGLSLGQDPSAVHVAVVVSDSTAQLGPDVVNGDGNRTGFSVVEVGTDQVRADAGHDDSTLAGYVNPP